ncbi:MAG: hypothetical protein OHK0017_02770 [Patescibacteria group bacterium]
MFNKKNLFYFIVLILAVFLASPSVYFLVVGKTQANTSLNSNQTQLEKENESLKKALQLNTENKLIAGEIKYVRPWDLSKVELEIGSEKGIKVGQTVVDSNGKLCGKISNVTPTSSEVLLITNNDFTTPVSISDKNFSGVLTGLYGYSAEIKWVNSTEQLGGQIVYTSDLSDLKHNVPIGKISNFKTDKDTPFGQGEIVELCNVWNSGGFLLIWQ